MKYLAESDRLYLRELDIKDAEHFYQLNLNPEVLKYTGDVAFKSINHAEKFIRNYSHYKDFGFGRWAVIKKDNDKFIGWCGIKFTPENNEIDLGFRLFQSEWNKGFATEAGSMAIHLAFTKFKVKTIVGRSKSNNIASIKTLEKLGFHYVRDFNFEGDKGKFFELKNPII